MIKTIPRFFNDISYVNDLFNTFNKKKLQNFLNEIKNYTNIFEFQLDFTHPLKDVKLGGSKIKMHDEIRIYFISPTDLIVDHHSYGSDFPFSDYFVSISQYRFHCDIKFNKKEGKFTFNTSAVVYNKLEIIKQLSLEKILKNESYKNNKVELIIHTWEPLKTVVETESEKNTLITDEIFKNNIMDTISQIKEIKAPKNYNVDIESDLENEFGNCISDVNKNIFGNSNKEIKISNDENKNTGGKTNNSIKNNNEEKKEVVDKKMAEASEINDKTNKVKKKNNGNINTVHYGIICIIGILSIKGIFTKKILSAETFVNMLIIATII